MDGMKSKRAVKVLFWLLIVSTGCLLTSCAHRKVGVGKPSPKKKIEQKGVYHVVERHQSLYRICKTYQVDMKEVASFNGIKDPSKIQTGQRIFIPGAKKALKVEIYIEDVLEESEEEEKETAALKKLNFMWPVEGRFTELFEENEGRRHQGIDISTPLGTPIKAASSGTVIYSGNKVKGYGNMIILRHSEEWVTVYAHNDVNLIEEGMMVERGQIIARVGQTGRATGPHLHFEMRRKNKAVDPLIYLK
jgi:murein DD-endopeptidase MepM/ murein hydrolase activator NlpD